MKKLRMIKIDGEKIQEIEINDNLKDLQREVDGYIECVDILDHITLICNEEGKLINLPINLLLARDGKIVEEIAR